MKKIYWHAHSLPSLIMVIFCIFVIGGLFIVEYFDQNVPQPYYQQKLLASSTAYEGFSIIKKFRQQQKIPISSALDPQGFGLIGKQLTDITSDSSSLYIKQTTINSNIAALFVAWLKQLNLKEGNVVAVGMTGSFPALDIAMLSAIKSLKLKPLLIFSGAASQYGANIPSISWLDMYNQLSKQKVFDYKVLGASLGGKMDKAYGMNKKGREILFDTIKKYKYHFIASKHTIDAIDRRIALYNKAVANKHILAYINVGGGMASIGLKLKKNAKPLNDQKPKSLITGVINKMPIDLASRDSVALRFLKQGVPVINVHNIAKVLVDQYGFPPAPKEQPLIGTGSLFHHEEFRTWLAALILGLDIIVFIIIVLLSKKYMIRYKL